MPNFVYTRDIPFSSHNPSNDQPPMQDNTNSTDSIIEVDHYSFNDNNGGYHKKVSLVNKTAPFPTPAGVGSVLYSSANEWVFTNNSLAGAGIQMTKSTTPPIDLANGSSFLPGGIVIQWGQGVTVGGVLTQPYSYAFTTLFSATATVASLGVANRLISVDTAAVAGSIRIYTSDANGLPTNNQVYWMAIGLV